MLDELESLISFIQTEYIQFNKSWQNSNYYTKINLKNNLIVDLSENDPLYKISSQYTTDHRNFFNREKLQKLLKDLRIIELSEIYRKDERRVGCKGYFGLTVYFGIKK